MGLAPAMVRALFGAVTGCPATEATLEALVRLLDPDTPPVFVDALHSGSSTVVETTARAVNEYNAHERVRVTTAGAHSCDVTALSRRHGVSPAFLAAGGLHPGAAACAGQL